MKEIKKSQICAQRKLPRPCISRWGCIYKHIIRLAVTFTAQVSREGGDGVKLPNSLAMAHFLHFAGSFYPTIPWPYDLIWFFWRGGGVVRTLIRSPLEQCPWKIRSTATPKGSARIPLRPRVKVELGCNNTKQVCRPCTTPNDRTRAEKLVPI